MLHELENLARRILNAEDFDVIEHAENSIHLVFTSDNFEITFTRSEIDCGEIVYLFTYNGSLPHRISYYRDYEEYEVANDLAEAFLIAENFYC